MVIEKVDWRCGVFAGSWSFYLAKVVLFLDDQIGSLYSGFRVGGLVGVWVCGWDVNFEQICSVACTIHTYM